MRQTTLRSSEVVGEAGDRLQGEYFNLALYEDFVQQWLAGQGVLPSEAVAVCQQVREELSRRLVELTGRVDLADLRDWLQSAMAVELRLLWRSALRRHSGPSRAKLAQIADQLDDTSSPLSHSWRAEYDRFVAGRLLEAVAERFHPEGLTVFREVVINQRGVAEVAAEFGMTVRTVRISRSRVQRAIQEICENLNARS